MVQEEGSRPHVLPLVLEFENWHPPCFSKSFVALVSRPAAKPFELIFCGCCFIIF